MTVTNSLILGALFASAAWVAFWPDPRPELKKIIPPTPEARRLIPSRELDPSDLATLADQNLSHRERYLAAEKIRHTSAGAIQHALEKLHQGKPEYSLPEASSILLIKWAKQDPEAALHWAWNRFKGGNAWKEAYQQIAQEWISSDHEAFLNYGQNHRTTDPGGSVTHTEADTSDQPILSHNLEHNLHLWLAKVSILTAFTHLRQERSLSSDYSELLACLETEQDFADALGLWSDYAPDPEQKWFTNAEMLPREISDSWRRKFPEDFAKTKFASWPLFGKTVTAPTDGDATLTTRFRKWKRENPGQQKNLSSLTPREKEAWQDFELLEQLRQQK